LVYRAHSKQALAVFWPYFRALVIIIKWHNKQVAQQASGTTSKWHNKQVARRAKGTSAVNGCCAQHLSHHSPSNMSNIPDAATACLLAVLSTVHCRHHVSTAIHAAHPAAHSAPHAGHQDALPGNISNIPDTIMARPTPFWCLKFRVKYILVKLIMYMF